LGAGSWKNVPYSEGAGSIAADLAFQNTSNHPCTISGFPRVTLYGASGGTPPTTQTEYKGAPVATLTVAPGGWVHSEVRYDPHMPGPTEPPTGACEPAAATMLVQLPGDSALEHVAVNPPTTFCDRGRLETKPFLAGPSSPNGG
jgi:hypothetical protein